MSAAITIRRFAICLLAGLLASAAAFPAGAQGLTVIRVATLPVDVASQAFYAADAGFFKAAGLDVQVTVMTSGPAIAAGVLGGDIDFGASNTITLAQAHERNVPIVLVAPAGAYLSRLPTSRLVVQRDSPIKSARDLVGKTVAVNTVRNIAQIGLDSWLERNGVDPKSVKLVEVPFPEMGEAVLSGRVDAASMDEPALSNALANGGRVLATPYDAVGKEWLQGCWFTTSQYAKSHPDVVAKFAKVMAQTADWANRNPDASAKILERYSKSPLVAGVPRVYFPPWFVRSQLQPLLDAATKYGVLQGSLDASEMFAPGIAFR